MTEKVEIDRWKIPKKDEKKYTRYHRVYLYDDNSLGCSCVDWREKKQVCAHIKFVEEKLKTIQYIPREEHKKGYKTHNVINKFSSDLPLRELDKVDLNKREFYLASDEKLKETKINDELSLSLACVGYELHRPRTHKEDVYPMSRGGGPTYDDYRFAIHIRVSAKGIDDDYFVMLDFVPYKKVIGSNTFVWQATLTDQNETEFDDIVSDVKYWVRNGLKGSFGYPSIEGRIRSSMKGVKFLA